MEMNINLNIEKLFINHATGFVSNEQSVNSVTYVSNPPKFVRFIKLGAPRQHMGLLEQRRVVSYNNSPAMLDIENKLGTHSPQDETCCMKLKCWLMATAQWT